MIADLIAAEMAGPRTAPAAVALRGVSRRFGHAATPVIEDVSFEVRAGEFVCLVGASGSGKSTVLNLVAGLDRPTSGGISVPGGQPALMFQEAALFPWLTAAENVEFPLSMQGVGGSTRRRRAAALLETVHLAGHEHKRPHELSGGMRQRVALARALAQDSSVLLMDEPFGSLDALTREHLHRELEAIWQQLHCSIIFVTHDVTEAVRLADRVLVLGSRPGRVLAEFAIDLPRPRGQGSACEQDLARLILERLRTEAEQHAAA